MPYLAIEDFKGGLDKRRMEITSPLGSLSTLKNAHVTRGGEVEKSLAFVEAYDELDDTFGLAGLRGDLYVFGSDEEPIGLDPDLIYQRLRHPDNEDMTGIVSIEAIAGKLYVVADFDNGDRLHFYDGVLVGAWYEGLVRPSMTNNAGIAEALRALIDAAPGYIATRSGAVITITGTNNDAYTVETEAVNGENNTFNDQAATSVITVTALPGQLEVLATGSFRINGGTASAGVNKISAITVDGVAIISGAVDWTASNSATATAVATAINSYSSTPDYSAAAVGDTVTITAAAGTGDGPNGFILSVTPAGNVTVANVTNFSGGVDAANPTNRTTGTFAQPQATFEAMTSSFQNMGLRFVAQASGTVQTVKINLTSYSAGGSFNARLYTDVGGSPGTQIGSNSASVTISSLGDKTFTFLTPPGLTAGQTYWMIIALQSGGPPSFNVSVCAPQTNYGGGKGNTITSITNNLTNGNVPRMEIVIASPGTAQVTEVTIGGTFEPGDKFSIILGGTTYGADRVTALKATAALKVHKNKVYTASQATLLFSAVAEPTQWGEETDTENFGTGAIDMSTQASGFEDVTAIGVYQGSLSVYSRRSIQIWSVDADPAGNLQLQVLNNIGTRSPGSVKGFGDSDEFFLSDTGVRSLRARDSSNAAAVSDVGTPIDPLVVADMRALADAVIEAAQAVIEPIDGRYMLALGTKMYVFSFFSSSKVSSWSTYERGLSVDFFALKGNSVYARDGNTIYLMGGDDGITYDDQEVIVETPFVNASRIASWKEWTGFDIACEGQWDVYICTDPANPTVFEKVATVTKNTYTEQDASIAAHSPMIKFKFVNTRDGYARIGALAVHFRRKGKDEQAAD